MSGHPPVDQGRGQVSGPCEPIYFGSGEHGLFGWLHRPTGDSPESTTGLVICKPFGYEAICAHKSIRGFAEASAAIGVPALRFDYLGTGDSADISPDANQLEVWSKDVLAAIAELQRRTGVKRVCLLGIRLGAVLATIAAAQCECVDSIVAISPIVSGRRFLRDIRTTRLAAGLAGDAGNSPGGDKPVNDGSMEVSGYSLSAATLAALAQLDLTTAARPARGMLIIDGSSMPVARKWSEALSGGAGRTEYLSLPGLIEMIMTAPHDAKPPQAMVEAMCHWLKGVPDGQAAPAETGDSRALDGGPISPTTVLELPGDGPARDAVITERAVSIDSRVPVFGILAEPRFGEARRRAVILVNAGSTYHIGPNRVHVSLARHWAKCGYLVLRIDLSGLGDSSRRPEALDNDVYPPDALDDIRAAIEFVRTRYGMDDITLCGFCSGAYHSLRAAVAAMPVNRVLLVNAENFFWKTGADIHTLELAEVVKRSREHRQRILSMAAWKRLMTGQVNIWRLVRIYIQRPVLAMESVFRNLARTLRVRLPRDLGWELEELAARGVRVVFVFSRGEAGLDLLRIQGGSSVKRLGDRCRVHIIDHADHIFSQAASRAIMERTLSKELLAQNRSYPISGKPRPGLAPHEKPA